MGDIRTYLRALKVFTGDLPEFDPEAAPPAPEALFVEWLYAAVEAGVREPHAMTLATVGTDGMPSGRVLVLKNIDEQGWQFAVHGASPKGQDLIAHPSAALTFYWSQQARQVRVRGSVQAEPAERSAADFLARPPGSRAEALLGRQSQPLASRDDLDLASKQSRERVDAEPGLIAPEWTLYTLRADTVEFWQGDAERKHTRVKYYRAAEGWRRELLWP